MLKNKTGIKEEAKEQIIKDFLPFIKYTAYRLSHKLPPHITTDDLKSVGFMGLMDAMERFEPGKVKLKTYAELRIKGSMVDELRAAEWIKRRTQEKIDAINKARTELENKHRRMVEHAEVAKALKMPLEKYFETLQYENSFPISMDELKSPNPKYSDLDISECIEDVNAKNPFAILEIKEGKKNIAGLIDGLPGKERLVLILYYYAELPMEKIGNALDMTKSRVCQLHSVAITKLREKLGSDNTGKVRVMGKNRN